MATIRDNPFRGEIIGTFLFAPLVIGMEIWRRWGDLLNPAALDDPLIFGAAILVATRLIRRDPNAPRYWLFVCGGAWFLFCLSFWGGLYYWSDGDPSGVAMPWVIAFKAFGLTLITWASWRASRRVDSFREAGSVGLESRPGRTPNR